MKLDDLPVSTLLVLAAAAGGIVALANGSIDFQTFLQSLGAFAGGAGVLGVARSIGGKGVRTDDRPPTYLERTRGD